MKILIISHSSDLAGAERSMLDLFDHWRKSTDVEAEFIIRKPVQELGQALDKHGFRYRVLYYTNWAQRNLPRNAQDIYWYAKQNTKAVAQIEKMIKKIRPDIVATNTSVVPWAAIAARNQRVPHVWFVREFGSADHDFEYRLGERRSFEIIGELSDLVVVNSNALARYVTKYIAKNKITTLYPNLDLGKLVTLSKEKIESPFKHQDSLKLVTTGRIASSKGQAVVAEAAGILNKQGINCELCVVGSPSDEGDAASLNAIIEKYDIADRVHLVGHQSNPLAYVALADIGVTASTKEAFGRITLEYMALGKPVVGTDSGGTTELVNIDNNGYLFTEHDASGLARILIKYADDRGLIKKHGKNSRRRAEQLMRQHTPSMLYEELLKISSIQRLRKDLGGTEWNRYPILLDQSTKKLATRLLIRYPHKAAKNFLKGIYLRAK